MGKGGAINTKPCRVVDGVKIRTNGEPRKGNNRPKNIGPYKKHTEMIDTRGNCGFTYEMYAKECEDEGIEPMPEDSSAFVLWINTNRAKAIDGFFDRITWCHDMKPAIITGTLEFFDGRKKIKPMYIEGENMTTFPSGVKGYHDNAIKKALIKCVRGMDDFKACMDRGGITLECFHGKYTNRFQIRSVSWLGEYRYHSMKERGKDMMELEPKKYWFGGLWRSDFDLDRFGRPIENPHWVE